MSKPKGRESGGMPVEGGARPFEAVITDLQEAVEAVARSYQHFIGEPAPPDAKGFAAHHSAAKSALAHLEHLMKLTAHEAARVPPPAAKEDQKGREERDALVKEARLALRQTS
ncbi:MAG: hypothetical protein ACPGOV_13345 [Magnetovibrionaceae bacterium]